MPVFEVTVSTANRIIGALNAAIAANDHQKIYFLARFLVGEMPGFFAMLSEPTRTGIAGVLQRVSYELLHKAHDPRHAASCAALGLAIRADAQILTHHMLAQLTRGDYDAAWRPDPALLAGMRFWRRGSGARRVRIVNSNGMGDLLQFIRFLQPARQHVDSLHLAVPRRLIPLLAGSPCLEGVEVAEDFPGVPFDAHCEIFFLPLSLGLGGGDLRPAGRYLHPDPRLAADWARVVRRRDALHVGLVWSGGGKSDPRSVGLAALAPLFELEDVVFVGLQSNAAREEMFERPMPPGFVDFGVHDIGNTAAIMDALDVVVTPDCGPAHLSCALGVPTIVLLREHCDWRWREPDGRSRWYDSAFLVRQTREGDWAPAVAAVRDILSGLRDRGPGRPESAWRVNAAVGMFGPRMT